MKKASQYIALALMFLFFIGNGIKINNESLLNDFWSGVIFGFLIAFYIFNFYLGYVEKILKKTLRRIR